MDNSYWIFDIGFWILDLDIGFGYWILILDIGY
jgi:hypothetical protein